MKKTIKYLQDGEYHYATVKDVGDLEQLKTQHKEDLVTALNELFTTGGDATPTGYDDLVKKVNDTKNTVDGISSTLTDVNGKVVANDEAIAQAKKDLQDALTQFQAFNDEIDQAKKDAETELANAKQSLKDEFNTNLADAQKANQKQLEDRVAAIQGNLDTTSNTLNDVKTQLTNAKLDYGAVNTSIQKLNDTLSTKLSSTDLDPLKTSIQSQETEIQQAKDSIATKAGKAEFDVLTGRVSTAEANIKQQADEISLGVKKSELNGAIDNYQIEGTNRLRNTIDFDIDGGYWKLDQYDIKSTADVHPYDQAHDVSALVLQKAGSAKQDVDFTNEDLGQSFVVSMWNKKDAQPQVWYGDTQLTNRQVAEIKGDYERSFFTFIPTNVNVKTLMFKYDAGTVDQLVIGEPKLELGTKPKAYAPNPNDEHKQIVDTKAELKIASDKIESTVEKQTKTDDNVNQLSSRVTQTEQGITATNDLITKTKDGLIKDYTGKIDASAKSLSSTFEEKTNEKIGQITDSGENLILNSAFTNETDRKDKWQNISDKVNIVADDNSLMWAHMSQSGLTTDNPISLTSNYFPIKQGKVTVGVDIKSDNTNGLSGAKILVLQTYNANKQRVDFTELSLEDMGLTTSQLADGQSHRGVYRLGNDRSDAVYMTVKAVLPRNGSIYFTNFSAKLSSIDNGGYTPNADDLKRQILNQKTKIEQNSQQITLKASSTELSDVRTIANGAVSVANQANSNANTANTNATNAVSVANSANNNANQAKSNANNAVATANSAKSTADSANNTASSAVTTANQANTTANTANSNANSANSKVTAIQANGGGRNLVANTDQDFVVDDTTNTGTQGWRFYIFSLTQQLKVGDQITVSAEGTLSGRGDLSTYDAILYDPNTSFARSDSKRLTAGKRSSVTLEVNNLNGTGDTVLLIYAGNIADTEGKKNIIHHLMVEKGTVAHSWQPAPEDIQTQIDQARTDIQSTLTVANNGITAATNLKTTYDNYVQKNDANIKLLGDRITNEVSKITSNGGGRNLALGTSNSWATAPDVDRYNITTIATYTNAQAGDVFTVSVDTQSTKTLAYQVWQGSSQYIRSEYVTGGDNWSIATGTTHSHTTFTWPSGATQYLIVQLIDNMPDASHASYQYKNVMLEKGVVAHDWQPAPEDTNSAIESVSSKIDQTATSITSTVNSTKQDLQGQINSANTKITQTADSITEQLKSYSKTGDMQNYVNTTIQKTADGINAKVSGVESRVNGIKIGGRNLAIGTGAEYAMGFGIPTTTWEDGYAYLKLPSNTTSFEVLPQNPHTFFYTLTKGTTYTQTIWFETDAKLGNSSGVQITWFTSAGHDGQPATLINLGENKYKLYSTYMWPGKSDNSVRLFDTWYLDDAFDLSTGTYLKFGKLKLEEGNVSTDWTPAPEDTDSAIQTTKADLVQQITDAKNAAIKVSQDSINSEVSDVRTTITQVNNKVDNIRVGGRNLLKDTDKMTNTNYWGLRGAQSVRAVYGNKRANEAGVALSDYNVQGNSSHPWIDYIPQVSFEQGADYTISFWMVPVAAPMLYLNANDNADHQHNNSQQNISLQASGRTYNGWKQVVATFKPTVATAYLTFAVSTAWVSSFKLEKGNKATDWSPSPEDVDTAISNVNTKVEQYKTGITQTATGMNLFAQVITGNKSIDVTKSNIGIDPNQIRIASNKIVIDGNTSINGTLNVPNVVLKGNSGSIDLSGDAINIVNNNSTYGLTLKSDGVAVGDKDRFYGLFTSSGIDLFTKSQDAPRPFSIGAIENDWLTTNHDIHGVSIIGKPYKDNKDNNFQGGNFINFGFQDPETTHNNPMISLYWRDLNVANDDKVEKGIHMYDDIYINHDIHLYKSPICVRTFGTQDPLMITGLKFGNSTQSDYFQPTLMAGWSNDIKGDSGLTFFWNSVKAFGTLDLTGTQIRMADAEANLEFGWVNWNDWTGKIPALFRRNGNNTGGIAVGGDCNVILFGNGHRWNLNERNGY